MTASFRKGICFFFALCISISFFAQKKVEIEAVGPLPSAVTSGSGLAFATKDSYWTHSGDKGAGVIYEVNKSGLLLKTVLIEGAESVDFEDMAQDENGNLYVGDFGNEDQSRIMLTIYQINTAQIKLSKEKSTPGNQIFTVVPEIIDFVHQYSTIQAKCHMDTEGMVYNEGNLYLFSRDRCGKTNNHLAVHRLSVSERRTTAEEMTYHDWKIKDKNVVVTSADLSRDKERLALLSNDGIHLFMDFDADAFLDGKYKFFPLKSSEKTAIVFSNRCSLTLLEQGSAGAAGRLLKVNLCE